MQDLAIVLIIATSAFFLFLYFKEKLLGKKHKKFKFPRDYLVGINYLLNEQEDKALEVFIKLLEVDQNTVETHLALGSLFRKKGEVDKAIRIHQNLIARPQLSHEQKLDALLALGNDYLHAGVIDRAERIFLDLLQANDFHSRQALYSLLDIYQIEKSWRKAIQISKKIQSIHAQDMSKEISHHYCELAQEQYDLGNIASAVKYLKSALSTNPNSIRAKILDANIYEHYGKYKKAIKVYKDIINTKAPYLYLLVINMMNCYNKAGIAAEGVEYLIEIQKKHPELTAVILASSEYSVKEINFDDMLNNLKEYPSSFGLIKAVSLLPEPIGEIDVEALNELSEIAKFLVKSSSRYLCQSCGFTSKSILWHCPSCKKWDSILPNFG